MTAQILEALPQEQAAGEPPWLRAFRRLVKRRAAMFGLGIVVFFILVAIAAPLDARAYFFWSAMCKVCHGSLTAG